MERVRCLRVAGGREIRGTVTWEEHVSAHTVYVERNKDKQGYRLLSARRIADIGGFGYTALATLLGHAPVSWQREVADE